MPRQKPSTELAALKKHQADLAAKLRAAQVKVNAEARANERLINECVGAVALKEIAANPSSPFAVTLRDLMNTGVTKAAIREALGLPALPKQTRKPAAAKVAGAAPTPKPEIGASLPPPDAAKPDAPPSASGPLTALRGLFGGGSPPNKGTK